MQPSPPFTSTPGPASPHGRRSHSLHTRTGLTPQPLLPLSPGPASPHGRCSRSHLEGLHSCLLLPEVPRRQLCLHGGLSEKSGPSPLHCCIRIPHGEAQKR